MIDVFRDRTSGVPGISFTVVAIPGTPITLLQKIHWDCCDLPDCVGWDQGTHLFLPFFPFSVLTCTFVAPPAVTEPFVCSPGRRTLGRASREAPRYILPARICEEICLPLGAHKTLDQVLSFLSIRTSFHFISLLNFFVYSCLFLFIKHLFSFFFSSLSFFLSFF